MNKFELEHLKRGLINQAKSVLGVLDEDIQRLADKRMEICNSCPNKSNLGTCKLCGCFLNLKTKAINSSCDDGKW